MTADAPQVSDCNPQIIPLAPRCDVCFSSAFAEIWCRGDSLGRFCRRHAVNIVIAHREGRHDA